MKSILSDRINLPIRSMPSRWQNIAADLPFDVPPMMSSTGFRITRRELEPLFPSPIIEQELGTSQRFFKIPDKVLNDYLSWRPTPLVRARRLEEVLGTPAKLYFKFEGGSPSGSYESNTAIPQAHYIKEGGFETIITGGAGGVWVMAMGHAAVTTGIDSRVYSVRESGSSRALGQASADLWGIDVEASPSKSTRSGKHALELFGSERGSIAIALAEAYEEATVRPEVKFAMPTLLNFTSLHQSIIGLEAKKQLKMIEEKPDFIVGAIGAGSHFAGLITPFLRDQIAEKKTRLIAVEEASTPSLSRGVYTYESVDSAGLMPSVQMYTVGRQYDPPGILSGSMRYHGVAPVISLLYRNKYVEAVVHSQKNAYQAGLVFTRAQGIILSPSSMYTVKEVLDQALSCKEKGVSKTILFSITSSIETEKSVYDPLLNGTMNDEVLEEGRLKRSLNSLLRK